MERLEIYGERKSKGQPINPGSRGIVAVKTVRVCLCVFVATTGD